MKNSLILLFCLCLLLLSCKSKNEISEKKYIKLTEKKFQDRKLLAKNKNDQLFSVLEQNLSSREKEALKFLFAYAPLNDLADYSGDFFLNQVRYAFMAKDFFSWGKDIPEDIFRHFVLPYRVNNENPDSARQVFFRELKPRISGLSMEQAALEVNHWCHEKVIYKGTDIRTSSPLSTIKTAYGRCGEESTFTVTALRAVGIPARQVYTPRWAHADDNHAWVEVWINGNWKFLGACEPEPELNRAWFTEAVKRAMMVHTTTFGKYSGTEEILKNNKNFAVLNSLNNYAKTKKIYVIVKDKNNLPMSNAKVEFALYNYAEFYPLATLFTNEKGIASLCTGAGTLRISAIWNNFSASKIIHTGKNNCFALVPEKEDFKIEKRAYRHLPPPEAEVSNIDFKDEEHLIKLQKEDSIRNAYITTFIQKKASDSIAEHAGLDKNECWYFFKQSRGNWKILKDYFECYAKTHNEYIFPLLKVISAKDLRDIEAKVLDDNIQNFVFQDSLPFSKEIAMTYVLNPRIKNEWLRPYKYYFRHTFSSFSNLSQEAKIDSIMVWMNIHLYLTEDEIYYRLPMTPRGVYDLRVCNRESKNIFFVALCRSLNMPARLDPIDNNPAVFKADSWVKVNFEKASLSIPEIGNIRFSTTGNKKWFDPAYGIHFSLARYENHHYKTLDLGMEKRLSQFPVNTAIEKGNYRFLCAIRQNDGSVDIHSETFQLKKDEVKNLQISFPPSAVLNKLAFLMDYLPFYTDKNLKKQLPVRNQKAIIIWHQPGTEPGTHLMRELNKLANNYKIWGGKIYIVLPENIKSYDLEEIISLKSKLKINILYDKDLSSAEIVKTSLFDGKTISYPMILCLDKNRNILFKSVGYRVGLGDLILFNLN